MTTLINDILIENFKSIKHGELSGCKRINLFIGGSNSGKSNMLEGLSIFSLPFLRENISKKISAFIRLENEAELFYNGNRESPIKIETNIGTSTIKYDQNKGLEVEIRTNNGGGKYRIDDRLNFRFGRNKEYLPVIRKYSYLSKINFSKGHSRYLIPPYGFNLLNTIEYNQELKEEISNLFTEYELQFVFDKTDDSLKIMRPNKNENDIFLVPYHSIGETLQRIIFFKTSIASNSDSILVFEEPEAHAFPPFLTHITQEMIHQKNNQYFVATHSQFILKDLLENKPEEVAVFIFNSKKKRTGIRKLTEVELHGIYQNGIDLFNESACYI
jgi:AAA15 family ATPase/GTPase